MKYYKGICCILVFVNMATTKLGSNLNAEKCNKYDTGGKRYSVQEDIPKKQHNLSGLGTSLPDFKYSQNDKNPIFNIEPDEYSIPLNITSSLDDSNKSLGNDMIDTWSPVDYENNSQNLLNCQQSSDKGEDSFKKREVSESSFEQQKSKNPQISIVLQDSPNLSFLGFTYAYSSALSFLINFFLIFTKHSTHVSNPVTNKDPNEKLVTSNTYCYGREENYYKIKLWEMVPKDPWCSYNRLFYTVYISFFLVILYFISDYQMFI